MIQSTLYFLYFYWKKLRISACLSFADSSFSTNTLTSFKNLWINSPLSLNNMYCRSTFRARRTSLRLWVNWFIRNITCYNMIFGKASINFTNPFLEYAAHPAFLLATIPTGQVLYMFETSRFFRLADYKQGQFFSNCLSSCQPVRRGLLCLPPTQFSFFRCRNLFGWVW